MDKTIQFYHKKLDREQNMQNSSSNNGTMAFGSNQQGIPGKQGYFYTHNYTSFQIISNK